MTTRLFQISFLAVTAALTAAAFAGAVIMLMHVLHELSARVSQGGLFLHG